MALKSRIRSRRKNNKQENVFTNAFWKMTYKSLYDSSLINNLLIVNIQICSLSLTESVIVSILSNSRSISVYTYGIIKCEVNVRI